MIRFIDLTDDYWTDEEGGAPVCAFLDTVSDTFVANDLGCHDFEGLDDFAAFTPAFRERLLGLVPAGFFEGTYHATAAAEATLALIEVARAPAREAAAKAAFDLSWRAADVGLDPTTDERVLLDLYRLARRFDGGGNLAIDGRITPRRPWAAGPTIDAEKAIERVEVAFARLLDGETFALPCDRTWALIEAVRRWGPDAGVEEREGVCVVGRWSPYPMVEALGEGPTWEEAFANAAWREGKARA